MNETTDQINFETYKHLVTKTDLLHQTSVRWIFHYIDRQGFRRCQILPQRKRLIASIAFMVEELGYKVVGNELHHPASISDR